MRTIKLSTWHGYDARDFSPLAGYSALSWFGQPTASLKLMVRKDGVLLRVSHCGRQSERSESVSEVVGFIERATALGGSRKWFRCNGCGKGCRILYGGQLFSMPILPQVALCLAIRGRLIGAPLIGLTNFASAWGTTLGNVFNGDAFPPKPPRMRWATYERLEALYNRLDQCWKSEIASFAACPLRLNRVPGRWAPTEADRCRLWSAIGKCLSWINSTLAARLVHAAGYPEN